MLLFQVADNHWQPQIQVLRNVRLINTQMPSLSDILDTSPLALVILAIQKSCQDPGVQ